LQEYLDEIIYPHPQLAAVNVHKLRFAFTVNGCIAEIAQLLINGAAIQTVAVEHTDIAAILRAKEMLGLNDYENVNYLRAIKRIIGFEPLPA
jgi:exopolyphosphatase/guanosine-5'-triphosphate,3'-diphosphate pyrophosphatase